MMERAFAAPADGSRRTTFNSATSYGPLDSLNTRLRLALDVESRMTPWDWCRHAQVVAEDAQSGRILGFAEVWGEDAESLNNLTAKSPQPVVFNLCVAKEARRRGVAMGMLARCEEEAARWGDEALHLKVREDNMAACRLYEGAGYELIETRPVADIPSWQEQWKGGVVPLRVMRKRPLTLPDSTEELGREVAPKALTSSRLHTSRSRRTATPTRWYGFGSWCATPSSSPAIPGCWASCCCTSGLWQLSLAGPHP